MAIGPRTRASSVRPAVREAAATRSWRLAVLTLPAEDPGQHAAGQRLHDPRLARRPSAGPAARPRLRANALLLARTAARVSESRYSPEKNSVPLAIWRPCSTYRSATSNRPARNAAPAALTQALTARSVRGDADRMPIASSSSCDAGVSQWRALAAAVHERVAAQVVVAELIGQGQRLLGVARGQRVALRHRADRDELTEGPGHVRVGGGPQLGIAAVPQHVEGLLDGSARCVGAVAHEVPCVRGP